MSLPEPRALTEAVKSPPVLKSERLDLQPAKGIVLFAYEAACDDRDNPEFPDLLERIDRDQTAYWAVLRGGDIIGLVEAHICDWSAPSLEAGYWIKEPERRRGYGAEAIRCLLDWIERGTDCSQVEFLVKAENDASLALVRSLELADLGERLVRNGGAHDGNYTLFAWQRDPLSDSQGG